MKKKKLKSSQVYIRIRPQVFDGGGHDQNGEAVSKSLKGWDETSVELGTEYMFSTGSNKYTFPKKVLGPQVDQQVVFDSIMPELVEDFTQPGGTNVMFFAYGQTGTGKTHTIFGESASLLSKTPTPGWGLFPRVCEATINKMKSSGNKFVLSVSAIEFYMCMPYDLLAEHSPILVSDDYEPVGYKHIIIDSSADLLKVLEQVKQYRTTRNTKMNQVKGQGEHDGSSRSHCLLILSLMQIDPQGMFSVTRFNLMDLAGAERPSKTGAERNAEESISLALYNAINGGEVSTYSQGAIINYELFEIGKEVLLATNLHKKGKKYMPPRQMTTALIKTTGACLGGKCRTAMIVCLSQAPQCGWETWFSLEYGTGLGALRAPVVPQKKTKFQNALKAAIKRQTDSNLKLENAKDDKFLLLKKANHVQDTEFLRRIKLLEGLPKI
mmetsp:Transcript_12820/g.20344  ORF Transcript_12820/g.20344 Transcript_12820/m.20344 type:complete len:438 (-) Transcript_12820:301-1614(-)